MAKLYNYDEQNILTPDRVKQMAEGLEEFESVYLRFLIPNIEDTKLKKHLKKLKKMIAKMKDKKKWHEVFNMKMVKLIAEEYEDENRGLF